MARFILCSGCGAKNRVAEGRSGQPKCGACGKPLTVPGHSRRSSSFLKRLVTWVVVGGVAFGGYQWLQEQKGSSSDPKKNLQSATSTQSTNSSSPDFSKFGQQVAPAEPGFDASPVPISTQVLQPPKEGGVAPLEIRTSAGQNYFVKLVDSAGRVVMTMLIEGGRRFETEVPLGTFEIRYASGKTWYGPALHFGPETIYAKADHHFEFTFDGSQYSGYTVELIMQSGGNLHTSRISPASF